MSKLLKTSVVSLCVIGLGLIGINSGNAKPKDFSVCDGMVGEALGVCRAGVAIGCADDSSSGNLQSCATIEENFEDATGSLAPWLAVCPCFTSNFLTSQAVAPFYCYSYYPLYPDYKETNITNCDGTNFPCYIFSTGFGPTNSYCQYSWCEEDWACNEIWLTITAAEEEACWSMMDSQITDNGYEKGITATYPNGDVDYDCVPYP